MNSINEYLSKIGPPAAEPAAEARERWNSLAKPLGGLGLLEEDVERIAALTGSADVHLDRRGLLVFCADNGVVAQGVTQCESYVTAHVARALASGRSSANPMAGLCRCEVFPVDMGIKDFAPFPGVISRRVRNGTADITKGPAMSREECLSAMEKGAALAQAKADEGFHILAVGEMGIGNTTTAAAVLSSLLKLSPERTAGRGAGLSDEGLVRKISAIHRALKVNAPDPGDPVDVLYKVGGLDIAAMCGAYLGGAACGLPMVVDGLISAAAALLALRLCPNVKKALFLSHISSEPASALAAKAIGLDAPIHAGMHLGEGTGAISLLPLLDMALSLYHSAQTFAQLGIEAYTPQGGTC